MVIGIIGAMDEEVSILLEEMKVESKVEKANMIFNTGLLLEKKIVVVKCGIGKVNAAICTQILIDDFNVDKVINVGVAGGVAKDIKPGDIAIGSNLVHHDMDTSAFGDVIGQIPRMDVFHFECSKELVHLAKKSAKLNKDVNVFVGRIVSGDQFINNAEKVNWMCNQFDAIACEMEGASIAQVCYLNSIPFVVIRSISDNAATGAFSDYEKFTPLAVKNSTSIIRNILKLIE
ncbi:5'-methylthioadenosine/adenosylhomocysteine nucleosidase [Clostridium sp. DL1XJH146]